MTDETRTPPPYPPATEPQTLAELSRVVGGYSVDLETPGYGMFWCMRGYPRAYMEIATSYASFPVARYVYSVIGFESSLPKQTAEPRLVAAMYRFLRARRKEALGRFEVKDVPDTRGDYPPPPALFVRRDFELTVDYATNKTRLTYRINIPGVDLSEYDIYRGDYHSVTVVYEPV
jgi:hypothetical protein